MGSEIRPRHMDVSRATMPKCLAESTVYGSSSGRLWFAISQEGSRPERHFEGTQKPRRSCLSTPAADFKRVHYGG
jgi:hypothetical protein